MRHQAGSKATLLGDEDGLSGDSGLPSDPVDEEFHKADQKEEKLNVRKNTKLLKSASSDFQIIPSTTTSRLPSKLSPVWESIAEELQAKLRFRRAKSEGLPLKNDVAAGPAAVIRRPTATSDTGVRSPPGRTSLAEVVSKTAEGETQKGKSEGLCSYDHSSSSGVEESETGSDTGGEEAEEETGGGVVRPASFSRSLGGLHHLRHFQQLQVVVLARNRLHEFPSCLLTLPGLTRLYLSHNYLRLLPHALTRLTRLVELDVSYNRLVGVGVGVGGLPALAHLRAAHNRITDAPELVTMETLRTLDVSGNQLSAVPGLGKKAAAALHQPDPHSPAFQDAPPPPPPEGSEPLTLNLSLNSLSGPVTLASIQNVTELDVSDNGITSLDVSCLAALTSLTCSNNTITSITLHGAALTSLTANNNRLSRLEVRYHPRRLTYLNLARNELSAVPPWLVSSTEVILVDVSHNQVTSLPAFLTSGHLRRLHTLSAHHNRLAAFPVPNRPTPDHQKDSTCVCTSHGADRGPHRSSHHGHNSSPSYSLHEELRLCSLEVLLLHHNKLTSLPPNLFSWLNRLRVLNVSSNQLGVLPGVTEGRGGRGGPHPQGEDSGSLRVTLSLQELYAAANRLKDLTTLHHCRALRILHAPYNRINNLQDRLVWSWELLEELVLSGNQLTGVPAGVSRLRRLRVLKVHSNPLKSLPRLAHLSALKVVDASHCQLGRVELEELVSPGLVALDISGNTALSLDHHQFTKCKSRRQVSVVDVTSRSGRSLPLTRPQANSARNQQSQRGRSCTTDTPSIVPWSLGFAEAIGRDSKLTIGQLRVPDVSGLGSTGIAALADGGQEVGSIGSLLAALPTLLLEECSCSHTRTYALKYALLAILRQLKSEGAILPSAVCAAHLETDTTHPGHWPVLRLCSYGPVSASVTTTHGQPIVLTTTAPRTLPNAIEECNEGLRCVLAEPSTLPDPQMTELHLGPHHTAVVIASASLWEVLEPKEAADVCSEVSEPGSAAKRLLDLAQSYGSRQALSVIVVRLSPPHQICHTYSPPFIVSQEKAKTASVANSQSIHDGSTGSEKEGNGNCRRVKFNSSVTKVDDHNNYCLIDNQRKCSVKHTEKFDSYDRLQNGAKNMVKSGIGEKSQEHCNVTPKVGELDRSSPSGQSQSDYSEHCVDIYRHARTLRKEPIITGKHKDLLHKSVEDLYAQPHRRKREVGKKAEAGSQIINYTSARKGVTYYHYPRPDPTVTPSENHLTEHLLSLGQSEAQTGVLAPPAGFGDIVSDSEGSDSGLSGVSGGQHHASPQNFPNSENEPNNIPQQVTEEQFRSWEYLLARNAKLLFMRELDSLNRPKSQSSPRPTASAPDLILAAATETEPSGHFQRNNVRKSRLGRGTFRLIQNKLNATTNKFNSLQKFKSTNNKSESNFRRFGSLQNLKYYQENRPRPPHYPLVQPNLAAEMQERPTLDSLELETRMHHYWHTGVTNF